MKDPFFRLPTGRYANEAPHDALIRRINQGELRASLRRDTGFKETE